MYLTLDWNEMYQEAVEKINRGEQVGSGTYNFVVPIERNGIIYAVRVAREETVNANTPFNDIQMLEDAYPQMGQIIEKFQEGNPLFQIPRLHYVSVEKLAPNEQGIQRPKFAVFDWVPQAMFLSNHPAYQYGAPLPDSASKGINDYIKRWPAIPADEIAKPDDWPGNNREFALTLLDHAQTQFADALPKYRRLFELLGFKDRPFEELRQAFSHMTIRKSCFIETDRNVENVLFSSDDPTDTPHLIDIDGFKIGDFVYGVKALEHRIGINLQDKQNERMRLLSSDVDSEYTQGWEEDIQYYDNFELIRNSIMRVLVNGKKYLENPETELPDKFIACYNELRTKVWRQPALSKENINQLFHQFVTEKHQEHQTTRLVHTSDGPNPDFLAQIRERQEMEPNER